MGQANQQQVDWKHSELSSECLQELHRLKQIEIRYRMAASMGAAFISYLMKPDLTEAEKESIEAAWYENIVKHVEQA